MLHNTLYVKNNDNLKNKYIKYKKKYLTLKKSMTGGGGVTIKVMLPNKKNIKLDDITLKGSLIEQIKEKLTDKLPGRIKVLLDDCPIEPYHTAEDCMLTKKDVLKIEYIENGEKIFEKLEKADQKEAIKVAEAAQKEDQAQAKADQAEAAPISTLAPISVPSSVSTLTQVETTKSINIQGLENLGNTCYMNSIIQCLAYTEPLTTYFLNNTWETHINKQSECKRLPEIWYQILINKLNNNTVYKPTDFNEFKNNISNDCFKGELKNVNQQQDSEQFLLNLLNGFEESFNNDDNIIKKIFKFTSTSTIHCSTCDENTIKEEEILILNLPIEGYTLDSCLEKYTEKEKMVGEEQYTCTINPNVTHKSDATKQFLLNIESKILIIQLKRFLHVGNKENGYVQMKMHNEISFPLKLKMPSKYLVNKQEQKFELYATCNHSGETLGSGHYYAYIKDNEEWYQMNDDTVTPCENFNNRDNTAYILFYKIISPSQNQQKYYKDFKALYQKYKSKYLVLKNKLSLI